MKAMVIFITNSWNFLAIADLLMPALHGKRIRSLKLSLSTYKFKLVGCKKLMFAHAANVGQ